MSRNPDHVSWWGLLPLLPSIIYVLATPYTKVEESFNIQAVSDILTHGRDLASYDHFDFPGVVPRTFLGALSLAIPLYPLTLLNIPRLYLQYATRILLATLLWTAFARFSRQVARTLGGKTAQFFILISLVQFHYTFYSSRTLANTFAAITVLVGLTEWFALRPRNAVLAFVISVVWFRCDMLILAGPLLLTMLFSGTASFLDLFRWGITWAALALTVSFIVDSYFWGRPLWPEGVVLYYNTVENKSSAWGTSPWHWYLSSAIPRAMSLTVLLLPVGLMSRVTPLLGVRLPLPLPPSLSPGLDTRLARLTLPVALFIGLYSILPHKELRFILPALPIFNLVAAHGSHKLWLLIKRKREDDTPSWAFLLRLVPFLFVCALVAGSAVHTCIAVTASHYNYPGGVALERAHSLVATRTNNPLSIHLDVPACETGVTRFMERDGWRYSKSEALTTNTTRTNPKEFLSFDVLITANASFHADGFEVLSVVEGFERLDLKGLQVVTAPRLWVLKRRA